MALPNKTKLQQIASQEVVIEMARNDYSANNEYDINKVPLTNGKDIGFPVDIAERTTEMARNDYSANKPYDLNSVQ